MLGRACPQQSCRSELAKLCRHQLVSGVCKTRPPPPDSSSASGKNYPGREGEHSDAILEFGKKSWLDLLQIVIVKYILTQPPGKGCRELILFGKTSLCIPDKTAASLIYLLQDRKGIIWKSFQTFPYSAREVKWKFSPDWRLVKNLVKLKVLMSEERAKTC